MPRLNIIVFANDERTKSGNIINRTVNIIRHANINAYKYKYSCHAKKTQITQQQNYAQLNQCDWDICRPPRAIQRERKFYVHRMNGYACLFRSVLYSKIIETFSHELRYNL